MLPSRFFDNFLDEMEPKKVDKMMKCDIYEENNMYHILMDAPGFKKEDIKIEAEDGNIIITAEKNENSKEEDKNKKYLRRERHFHSRTQRAFYLGDIDEDNIKATFDNGVLKVTVPKKQIESNRKLIDIE